MQLMEGDNFETPNTFYVKGKQKSLELHTKLVIVFLSSVKNCDDIDMSFVVFIVSMIVYCILL